MSFCKKEEFLKVYGELKCADNVDKDVLLREIFEFVLKIDFGMVDFDRSVFEKREGGYDLRLVSLEGYGRCNVYIEILNQIQLDIQIGKGGEYIYFHPMLNWSDIGKLRIALNDLFTSEIEEVVVVSNSQIKSVSYSVNHKREDGDQTKTYAVYFGTSWFWQNKLIQEKVYSPWIQ